MFLNIIFVRYICNKHQQYVYKKMTQNNGDSLLKPKKNVKVFFARTLYSKRQLTSVEVKWMYCHIVKCSAVHQVLFYCSID